MKDQKPEKVTLYLPPDVLTRLKMAAFESDKSASNIAAEILGEHLPWYAPLRRAKAQKAS